MTTRIVIVGLVAFALGIAVGFRQFFRVFLVALRLYGARCMLCDRHAGAVFIVLNLRERSREAFLLCEACAADMRTQGAEKMKVPSWGKEEFDSLKEGPRQ